MSADQEIVARPLSMTPRQGDVGSIPNTQPGLKRGAVSEGMEESGIERGLSTLADSDSQRGDSWLEMVMRARGNFVALVAGDIATRPAHIGHGQLDDGRSVPMAA